MKGSCGSRRASPSVCSGGSDGLADQRRLNLARFFTSGPAEDLVPAVAIIDDYRQCQNAHVLLRTLCLALLIVLREIRLCVFSRLRYGRYVRSCSRIQIHWQQNKTDRIQKMQRSKGPMQFAWGLLQRLHEKIQCMVSRASCAESTKTQAGVRMEIQQRREWNEEQ